eukprot:3894989-Prymnesium_polylepis.1
MPSSRCRLAVEQDVEDPPTLVCVNGSFTYETRWLRASGTPCTDRRYDVKGCRIECTRGT